jgi:hypothetical protein
MIIAFFSGFHSSDNLKVKQLLDVWLSFGNQLNTTDLHDRIDATNSTYSSLYILIIHHILV